MLRPAYGLRQVFGTFRGVRLFLSNLLVAFGIVSALLRLMGALLPAQFNEPRTTTTLTLVVCVVWGLVRTYPRARIRHEFKHPTIAVTIGIGDLFEQEAHIVVGFSDTFDTETTGDRVISGTSVQGQLLERYYDGDRARLDRDLNAALAHIKPLCSETRSSKRKGKLARYPIGTVAVVGEPSRLTFGLAYSRMGNDLVARSSVDDLWLSLNRLWDAVYERGQQRCVAMPVTGSGLARIDSLDRGSLIRMILLSFMARSREVLVARELRIVIWPPDLKTIDMLELVAFVRSL